MEDYKQYAHQKFLQKNKAEEEREKKLLEELRKRKEDEDKKELLSSRYEYIGLYEPKINIWTWAWAIPAINKKNTNFKRLSPNHVFSQNIPFILLTSIISL